MTRAGERKIAKKEQVNGGAGHVLMEALLNEEERGEHCRIFSQVTIGQAVNLVIMSIMEKLRLIMYFPAVRLIWTTIKNTRSKPAMLHFAKMETDMELRITEQNQLYL